MRIRKDIENAPVEVPDEDGNMVPTKITLQAGWWALPDPVE